MTQSAATGTLPIGKSLTCQAGRAIVTLTRTAPDVYYVETVQTHVLTAYTRSFATEAEARSAARRIAVAFREHGDVAAILRRETVLRLKVRDLLNSRRDTRRQIAKVEAELELLADLNVPTGTAGLAAA